MYASNLFRKFKVIKCVCKIKNFHRHNSYLKCITKSEAETKIKIQICHNRYFESIKNSKKFNIDNIMKTKSKLKFFLQFQVLLRKELRRTLETNWLFEPSLFYWK